ncbi:MAG: hypothetical protein IJU05_05455, partial [Schwartzia sp.]|nr:hypothetical protein [Schwartzia sp. (in: firmicutes)]
MAGWFCLMYVANEWMPLYRDDYWAALVWKTGDHLESMGDVFLSLGRYYMMHGGRLVSFFIQFAFMLAGKFWFNIANAAVFSAMCAVMVMHARRKADCLDAPAMLVLAGAFLWLGVSHFGEVAIWLCGSAVYLWTGLLTAVFLLPYNLALAGQMKSSGAGMAAAMLLLGAVASCSVENLTVTTTLLAFWCSRRAHRQGIFSSWMGAGAVGSAIGSVVCLVAPGNFVRIEEDQDRSFWFHFLNQIAGNLEMVLYMMPILLTLVLAVRLLFLASAERRGIGVPSEPEGGHHYVLLGVIVVSVVSFFTTGFLWQAIEAAVVHGVFLPLGLTDPALHDRFNNTMQGFEEALIYLAGVAYVYLGSVRTLGVSKARVRGLKETVSWRMLAEDFPALRYAAFLIGLCFFNNFLMIGAPSFPGRVLFGSSVMLILGVMAVLGIPEARDPLLARRDGRVWRRGGVFVLGFIVIATLVVLHSIWKEDALRLAYIAQ